MQATCSVDGVVRIYEATDVMNLSIWNLQHEIQTRVVCSCLSWSTSKYDVNTFPSLFCFWAGAHTEPVRWCHACHQSVLTEIRKPKIDQIGRQRLQGHEKWLDKILPKFRRASCKNFRIGAYTLQRCCWLSHWIICDDAFASLLAYMFDKLQSLIIMLTKNGLNTSHSIFL